MLLFLKNVLGAKNKILFEYFDNTFCMLIYSHANKAKRIELVKPSDVGDECFLDSNKVAKALFKLKLLRNMWIILSFFFFFLPQLFKMGAKTSLAFMF